MNSLASRLATALILALAVRAAAQPTDPYAGQYQQPIASQASFPPGAMGTSPPPDGQRYPLSAPAQQPPPIAQPPIVQPPVVGQGYGGPVVQRPVYGQSHYGGPMQPAASVAMVPQHAPSPAPPALFEPAQIIAVVGDKHILYGDVAPTVNLILEPMLAKAKSDFERQQLEQARPTLVKNVLRQMVETKLMYLEFEREMQRNAEGDAEQIASMRRELDKKITAAFEEKLAACRRDLAKVEAEGGDIQTLLRRDPHMVRLAILMKDHRLETLGDLDALLRRFGSSLALQIDQFGEHELGMEMMRRSIRTNPDVTHQEMLDYYRNHAAEYFLPAKARFELLTVKFSNFPSRNEAWNAICAMGNEVYYGKPFASVARQSSQEPQAQHGGFYDWTTKGSLASKPIDHAVFTLEPGKLSQIIEDERGFHIVRVIERQEEGMVSFLDAQPKIREAIQTKKREGDYKRFLAGLSTRTQVWTIYDEAAVAQQPGATMQR